MSNKAGRPGREHKMKVRVCPKCGTHNEETAWFCAKEGCGQALSITTIVDTESGVVEPQTEVKPELPLPGKPPWDPKYFTFMAFIFSFGASGILAGLNWRRLGKPQRMWPTILLSLAGLAALFAVEGLLQPVSEIVAYLINIGIAALLARFQASDFQEWVATYGKPKAKESGYLIPIVVGIGTTVAIMAFVFAPTYIANRAIDHFNKGVEYHQQGKIILAIEEYTKAININPQLVDAYLNRGNAYLQQGNLDLAITDSDQALRLNPQLAQACINRGIAYAILGQYDPALADLSRAIESFPQDASLYYLRGMVYAEIGEPEEAILDLERALELGLYPPDKQEAEAILDNLRQ